MMKVKEQFLTDPTGKRIGVLLELADYERLVAEPEELESIRAYDAAKATDDEAVPFDQAVSEIERNGI